MSHRPTSPAATVLPFPTPSRSGAGSGGGAASTVEAALARIEAALSQLLHRQRLATALVLPRRDAIGYCGHRSASAFDAWCQRHRVRPCAHGRYDARSLRAALEREARGRVKPRTTEKP